MATGYVAGRLICEGYSTLIKGSMGDRIKKEHLFIFLCYVNLAIPDKHAYEQTSEERSLSFL